jgi:predicted homoserine dehydrogenase-like protein
LSYVDEIIAGAQGSLSRGQTRTLTQAVNRRKGRERDSMLSELLAQRERDGSPIRVGLVGAGKFGTGLVAQVSGMKGMEVRAIGDINLDSAKAAFGAGGHSGDETRVVQDENGLADALTGGKRAITDDAELITRSDQIDVVVDATGVPSVGPYLKRRADAAGVVYSLVDGDQPGCTMNMVDWASSLGFEIVAAGRGTIMLGDDREGIPDTVPARFGLGDEMIRRRRINLKMYNSFRDGTKAQCEMTALSNMTGLPPDVRGMHEPSVNIADIARVLSLEEEGGILGSSGVVELANSIAEDGKTPLERPLDMGVFVVIRTDHPFIQEDLKGYIAIEGGKNFLLYRPYHLVAVEAPITIAKAALLGMPTGAPVGHTSDLITVAKKDLKPGEVLDGGGGYTVSGLIERADTSMKEGLLPLGLSAGATLKSGVAQGAAIRYADVEMVDSFVHAMRKMQDTTLWQGN